MASVTRSSQRLAGTKISLLGATTKTTCGTISKINSNRKSVDDQTYTVSCPTTTEPTVAVFLYDETTANGDSGKIVMNIAEVMVYSFKCEKEKVPNLGKWS